MEIPLESNQNNNLNLKDKLRLWVLQFYVFHNCGNSILNIMRSEGLDLPKDIRTLMRTSKTQEITYMSGGSYIHLGLKIYYYPF